MLNIKRVTAAIIIQEGHVLLVRRAPGENFAGDWEFPGGKVEAGETTEACLARELKEELSIEAQVEKPFCESIYEYPQGCIQLMAYTVKILSGEMQLSVHDRLEWASKENLLEFGLLPADIPIAKKIVEELL